MFKRTLQQQQQFKDSVYIKCSKKNYFTKNYKGSQQSHAVKGTNMSRNNNDIKVIRKCLIKYFTFYYNSVYKVYKDTKYGVR